jgi:hypothetical protein
MMERDRNHFLLSEKFKYSLICFILLWGCAACNLAFADPGVGVSPTEIEKEVLELINIERQKNGLQPLVWDKQLYEAAQSHSEEMASEKYSSYAGLNEKQYVDRIREAGYDGAIVSKIIGAGQNTAQQIFDAWRADNDLREDMLDIAYCNAAIGHIVNKDSDRTDYWTLEMGCKNSIAQCASIEPAFEPEAELVPEPDPQLKLASTADGPGFCEELIQRHEEFCKKHPDLCLAALNKCKRSQ